MSDGGAGGARRRRDGTSPRPAWGPEPRGQPSGSPMAEGPRGLPALGLPPAPEVGAPVLAVGVPESCAPTAWAASSLTRVTGPSCPRSAFPVSA